MRIVLALTMLLCINVLGQEAERSLAPTADLVSAVRFASLDVVIDSPEPLAAWQFELTDRNGAMLIVGVENGDSDAFAAAPYFDLDAVQDGTAERIIVADFNAQSGADLPIGATRIATVHVQLDARITPDYELRLVAAGNAAGDPIDATIRLMN